MMEIINKTPHPINIVDNEGKIIRTIEKDKVPIRLASKTVQVGKINNIPISETKFGEPTGLPESVKGVFYIVSQLVMNALPHRTDFLIPAEVARDNEGNIIGCRSLGKFL